MLYFYKVTDPEFSAYGQVLTGYGFASFLDTLKKTELPPDGVVYVPSDSKLESDTAFTELQTRFYGGMPIQAGYCNGVNSILNCLEYHRDSEVNIAVDDCILLLALRSEIDGGLLDTALVKAFLLPAGMAVEIFATSLHYAPCSAAKGEGFRVSIVLPLGTNTEKPAFNPQTAEEKLMTAKNKWLLAHQDSPEAKSGAIIGLKGKNLDLNKVLW